MGPGMVANHVGRLFDALNDGLLGQHSVADHEEGGGDGVAGEDIEKSLRAESAGSVVEGEREFLHGAGVLVLPIGCELIYPVCRCPSGFCGGWGRLKDSAGIHGRKTAAMTARTRKLNSIQLIDSRMS